MGDVVDLQEYKKKKAEDKLKEDSSAPDVSVYKHGSEFIAILLTQKAADWVEFSQAYLEHDHSSHKAPAPGDQALVIGPEDIEEVAEKMRSDGLKLCFQEVNNG